MLVVLLFVCVPVCEVLRPFFASFSKCTEDGSADKTLDQKVGCCWLEFNVDFSQNCVWVRVDIGDITGYEKKSHKVQQKSPFFFGGGGGELPPKLTGDNFFKPTVIFSMHA